MVSIIGIGSPFGADRVGLQVMDWLARDPALARRRDVRLCHADRPGVRLLDDLYDVDAAILVDAVYSAGPAGQVLRLGLGQLSQVRFVTSSHAQGVAETLALGQVLGLLPAFLSILGMAVEQGRDWQPRAEDMQRYAQAIRDEVERYLNDP